MSHYVPLARGIARLFTPFVEVVLHDLKTGNISFIHNAFSKRKVGDPSYLDSFYDWTTMELENCVYEKINFDGRTLKSVSIPLMGEDQKLCELLCINFDISFFAYLKPFLDDVLDETQKNPQPEALFKEDLDTKLHLFIQDYLKKHNLSYATLRKEDKRSIVHALKDIKAFDHKNAAESIGRILDLSRATIYNYLKSDESKNDATLL